ncbi:chemotaxis protein CheW [Jannaschia donghaensis]|uniref:Chemotaxis protein CheW n=1 Tax=Jannaschia donghaensis TaxID=420998 RepID=A0A0M6YNT0_9RHOB|nr:chemotaxis protein CheW [Jannaschia donghaensis]CTQ50666.1 Chemotaxis protein CheW [Jannaschia donghaensis]
MNELHAQQIDSVPPPENEAPAPSTELLTFRCGGQAYAVDIMCVREIRGWSEPTPLPHAPPYMRGMVNLRGSVLPVMDLAQRMGQSRTEDHPRNVIVVVQDGTRVHGLLVDAVSDIVHPRLDQLQDVPHVANDDGQAMAERLFVVDDTMIQVLATAQILPRVDTRIEDHIA